MLNTSLAIDPDAPVPPLTVLTFPQAVPSWTTIKSAPSESAAASCGNETACEARTRVP
jgi:hypothetical protein